MVNRIKDIERAISELKSLKKTLNEMHKDVDAAYKNVHQYDKMATDAIHEIEMLDMAPHEIAQAGYDIQFYKRSRRQAFYTQDTIGPFCTDEIYESVDNLINSLEMAILESEREKSRFNSLEYKYRVNDAEKIERSYHMEWDLPVRKKSISDSDDADALFRQLGMQKSSSRDYYVGYKARIVHRDGRLSPDYYDLHLYFEDNSFVINATYSRTPRKDMDSMIKNVSIEDIDLQDDEKTFKKAIRLKIQERGDKNETVS